MNQRPCQPGFTLIEVMIATLVLVTAALVVLMLLPGALRGQQTSRYQMVAAAHAQSMLTAFYQHGIDLNDLNTQFLPDTSTKALPPRPGDAAFKGKELRDAILDRRLLSQLGNFDLERVVGTRSYGNYPVPLPIARRLDSPQDEIRHILDGGGYIYYTDPSAVGRGDDKLRKLNYDRNERGEQSRLVWGVVGYAQAPVLPYNPWAVPHQEMYPFPPLARLRAIDRFFAGTVSYAYEKDGPPRSLAAGESWNGAVLLEPITVQAYRRVETGRGFTIRDASQSGLATFGSWANGDGRNGYDFPSDDLHSDVDHNTQSSRHENNNWEWHAAQQPSSTWAHGLAAWRRLVYHHWLRLHAQIVNTSISLQVTPIPSAETKKVKVRKIYFAMRRGPDGTPLRDAYGQPFWDPKVIDTETSGVKLDSDKNVIEAKSSSTFTSSNRGYPAPANGLPISKLRGSDILEEDAEVSNLDLANQIRVSLPSLERRIMYRSAALALWAAVAYDGMDITDPEQPTRILVEPDDASPSPSVPPGRGLLRRNQNPLLAEFMPPSRLDAAQVLALSHVAHAAIMVTGYKPPFYNNNNSNAAHDDELLVRDSLHPLYLCPEDELPFRANEPSWLVDQAGANLMPQVWVPTTTGDFRALAVEADGGIDLGSLGADLHPSLLVPAGATSSIAGKILAQDGTVNTRPIVVKDYAYLRNPYHPEVLNVTTGANPLIVPAPVVAPSPALYLVDPSGRAISYRRMIGGQINPFPPPYADAKMIDLGGNRRYQGYDAAGAYDPGRDLVRWQLAVEWLDSTGLVTNDVTKIAKPQYRLIRRIDLPESPLSKTWKGPGSLDPQPGTDSFYARHAHAHALQAAMDYVSRNPYDQVVPKPMNRQICTDQGIYQFDLFDASGLARRPQGMVSDLQRVRAAYTITCPVDGSRGDIFRPGAQFASPQPVDGIHDYKVIHGFTSLFPPERDCTPYQLGSVYAGTGSATGPYGTTVNLAGNKITKPWKFPTDLNAWINYAHGWDATTDLKTTPARPDRCTATRAFSAAERTRQLVYWLVDWQQYEDSESAPSAPVDASQCRREQVDPFVVGTVFSYGGGSGGRKILKLRLGGGPGYYGYTAGSSVAVRVDALGPDEVSLTITRFSSLDWEFQESVAGQYAEIGALLGEAAYFHRRQGSSENANEWNWLERFSGDNPEASFTWVDPERSVTRLVWDPARATAYSHLALSSNKIEQRYCYLASGHTALPLNSLSITYLKSGAPSTATVINKDGIAQNPLSALGAFGADRNGNGRFDSGPVPASTRMQALEIARFNFYDPIAWVSLGR